MRACVPQALRSGDSASLLPRSPALVSAVIIIVMVVVIVVRTKQQRQRERKEEGHRQRNELLYLTLPHALGEP